jgi:DNA-binding NarL/FixJ family response regulator
MATSHQRRSDSSPDLALPICMEALAGLSESRSLAHSWTVYLVDEAAVFRGGCAAALRADGHEVIEVADVIALLTRVSWEPETHADGAAALVVASLEPPITGELALLGSLLCHGQRPPFVLLSRRVTATLRREAEQAGALAVFDKTSGLKHLRRNLKDWAEDQWFLGSQRPLVASADTR